VQFDLICDDMARDAPNAPSARWLELDWQFHQTIVETSGNERFINDFALLMIECNYVFYRLPETMISAKSSENPLLSTLVHGVVEAHRRIVRLMQTRDTNGVVESMRLHLAGLSNRVHRDVVRSQLAKQKPK
jgi:DNA-binding GntR family transcriptional regulator